MPYKDPKQRKAYKADYDAAHREQRKTRYIIHLEEDKARSAAWRANHPEEVKTYKAAYYYSHPEEVKAYNAAWRADNRQEQKTYSANYRQANKDAVLVTNQRRQALKRRLPATLTRGEWEAIKVAYKHRCAYCGKKQKRLTQDHVIPLSKGGGTTMGNIIPACQSCNSRKGSNLPAKPVKLVLL